MIQGSNRDYGNVLKRAWQTSMVQKHCRRLACISQFSREPEQKVCRLHLANKLLGQVYLQCRRRDMAIPLLQTALLEVDSLPVSSLRKQFKRNLKVPGYKFHRMQAIECYGSGGGPFLKRKSKPSSIAFAFCALSAVCSANTIRVAATEAIN